MFYPFSQELGWNFVDPIPLDVLPAAAEIGEKLAGTSATSKSQTSIALPGVSSGFVDVYEEYVPRLVPRGPRSVPKRGRTDGSSSGLPVSKKPRKPSTPSGTLVVASMLLGEHIYYSLFLYFPVSLLNRVLFILFLAGALVSLAEGEEDDEVPLIMRR